MGHDPAAPSPSRPRRRALAGPILGLVLLGLVGCSDPATSPLAAGSAVVLDFPGDAIDAADPSDPKAAIELPSGTRATVVADPPARPPTGPDLRLVRLRVEGGPRDGAVVEVARYLIRAGR